MIGDYLLEILPTNNENRISTLVGTSLHDMVPRKLLLTRTTGMFTTQNNHLLVPFLKKNMTLALIKTITLTLMPSLKQRCMKP